MVLSLNKPNRFMEVILIYQNFLSLEEDKQQTILRACLREFGRYGYQKTSIDQVAKASGISKSMVFYYFGTKVGLYSYLLDYSIKILKEYFKNTDELVSGLDYIEKYQRVVKVKLEAYFKHHEVFEFVTMLFLNPENTTINPTISEMYEELMDFRQAAFMSLQESEAENLFKDEINPDQARKYINWIMEGFSQSIIARIGHTALIDADIDDAWEEFDEILDDLRRLFYKENKGGTV